MDKYPWMNFVNTVCHGTHCVLLTLELAYCLLLGMSIRYLVRPHIIFFKLNLISPYLTAHRVGMPRGIPHQLMLADNRAKKLDPRILPSPAEAVHMYEVHGGHLTEEGHFGKDPLANDTEKCRIRETAFIDRYPSFEPAFHNIVNGNDALFREELKYFIDISYRLSAS